MSSTSAGPGRRIARVDSKSAPSTGASDGGEAASILAAANADGPDSDELTQLRAALDVAASRPRDIDVMMDMVSRAGAIQDLLAERDRYSETIAKALAALNNPSSNFSG